MSLSGQQRKRLQDLQDNIAKDEKLLKDFEDALRYEKDPRVIAGYRREIERQRESITRYESEMRELQQKLTREPSTQMRMQELDDNTKPLYVLSIPVTNHKEEENQDTKINYPIDSKDKTQHSSNPTDTEVETYIERGIDYTQLQEYISSGKWKKADQETTRVMLEVANRQEEGWLRSKDIEQLSCSELCRIDQLWVKYSNGRFGFSVQRHIWLSLGGQPGKFNFTVFCKFGNRVGWRVNNDWLEQYDQFTFASDAPKGHLPSLRLPGSEKEANWWDLWQKSFRGLLLRMEDCSLS
ncbi:MAG: GUN4 domain-containing protein [Calothrix sp. MO_167.B12]|nr:GUN4 domain-containing protein [Calothrix sp. MO_167.B12]